MKICRIAPHYFEEPPISGTKGSGTVFFSGCSLDCEFCQNHEISKASVGRTYTPEELAEEFKKLEESGVHNINLVTPTHFSDKIRTALDLYRPHIPIVYNTSGYELPSVVRELLPYVDIFLYDVKYASDDLAKKYSRCDDYVAFNRAALAVAVENKPIVMEGDLMKQGVIVRHLVLPENVDNTLQVIDYYAEHLQHDAYLSVMAQFIPAYRSSLKRTLSPLEYKIVLNKLFKYDFDKCFIQDLSSASDEYVPTFYTGED